MAGAFTTVNLSQLAAPNAVESLDFETIFAAMLSDMQSRMVAAGASFTALLESDPVYKILEVCAYRELLVRQRANEAVRAVMLAFATDSDLDHIGANFNVARKVIRAADPTTTPPTEAVYELDDDYRARIPLSLEGYTTAGSEGSYVFHALSATGTIKDVSAVSPAPGQVTVYVLSTNGDGTASNDELAAVTAAVNADSVRPMTDQVTVQSSTPLPYVIDAELVLYSGPSADVVVAAAVAAAQAYADSVHRNGYDVSLSGIFRALHQPGVDRVNLNLPTGNIPASPGQAPYCTAINVTVVSA
jgi:phage-related baseplate assembly protein